MVQTLTHERNSSSGFKAASERQVVAMLQHGPVSVLPTTCPVPLGPASGTGGVCSAGERVTYERHKVEAAVRMEAKGMSIWNSQHVLAWLSGPCVPGAREGGRCAVSPFSA